MLLFSCKNSLRICHFPAVRVISMNESMSNVRNLPVLTRATARQGASSEFVCVCVSASPHKRGYTIAGACVLLSAENSEWRLEY